MDGVHGVWSSALAVSKCVRAEYDIITINNRMRHFSAVFIQTFSHTELLRGITASDILVFSLIGSIKLTLFVVV